MKLDGVAAFGRIDVFVWTTAILIRTQIIFATPVDILHNRLLDSQYLLVFIYEHYNKLKLKVSYSF